MASRFLYHLTPAPNVVSILATGLEPRSGRFSGHEWPARVWFSTSRESVFQQWLHLSPRDYGFPKVVVERLPGGVVVHEGIPLVIIVIDRKAVRTQPTDMPTRPSQSVAGGRRKRNSIVWTTEHVPPSAIVGEPLTWAYPLMPIPEDYDLWCGWTAERKAGADRSAWTKPPKPIKIKARMPSKRIEAIARTLKPTPKG